MLKALLLAAAFFLFGSCCFGAVAHVASSAGYCTGGVQHGNMVSGCTSPATTDTFTYTPTASGNVVLIAIGCADNSTTPTAVSLTATGWTINPAVGIVGNTADGFNAAFWAYAPNTSAATFTMTWTATTCTSFMNDLMDEFSGMNSSNPVDTSTSFTGSSGCSTSITPVTANDGLWAACNDTVTGAGSGYTIGANDTSGDQSEWKILSGGAGVGQTVNFASSGGAVEIVVAIKPPSATAATMPPQVY